MANSKFCCLLPLLFIAVVVLTMQTAMATDDPFRFNCSNFGTIPPKPGYQNNVNKLLGALISKAPINGGFSSGSAGKYKNKVYGLALCRGDLSSSDCKSCLADARNKISQVCQNTKGAIIWYNKCLLKYSHYNFLGKIDNVNKYYQCNPKPVSNPKVFNPTKNQLLRQLAAKATGQKRLYAAGVANAGRSVKVYGYVQCTRDLSGKDCRNCLYGAIAELQKCCDSKQGGRYVGGSCFVRYEIFPFLKSN